jgi:hypothetical protein
MPIKNIIFYLRLILLLAGFGTGSVASAGVMTGQVSTVIIIPLTIIKFADLNFGNIIPSASAGTVAVDPFTGSVTLTGGVIAAGGPPNAAFFETYGGPLQTLTVNRGPYPVLSDGNGHTMNVTQLTLDGSTTRFLSAAGLVQLHVGGTLQVGANQAGGNYTGNFLIYVTYQ